MKTIIEPFKIKTIEPLRFTTRAARDSFLKRAGYNLFNLHAEEVLIDLLTDSGTAAMSAKQWAGLIDGDESYAGARSFYRFEKVVKELTGYKHIIPTHQGRAAEKILFEIMGGKGKVIPNNTHFDTTRANIEVSGAEAVDLPVKEALIPSLVKDFKGNMNITALERLLKEKGREHIPLVMMTVTNNSCAGQPVSMGCIRRVSELCRSYKIPFFIDACRFAENAWFVKTREPGCKGRSVKQLAQEMFSYADGCTMSGKKDGLVNIGGFLAMNDDELAQKARNILIVTEGFPTYGGLAGRDLEAFAQGLEEVVDEDYLKYRIRSTEYVVEKLDALGVPVFKPAGGHAVYLDAQAFLPQVPPQQLPRPRARLRALPGRRHPFLRDRQRHVRQNRPCDRAVSAGPARTGAACHPAAGLHPESHGLCGGVHRRGVCAAGQDPGDAHRLGAAGVAALHGNVRICVTVPLSIPNGCRYPVRGAGIEAANAGES